MFLRVKRPFRWVDELPKFNKGEVIEIGDRHPRLESMMRALHVYEDPSKTQDEMRQEYEKQMAEKKANPKLAETPLVLSE